MSRKTGVPTAKSSRYSRCGRDPMGRELRNLSCNTYGLGDESSQDEPRELGIENSELQ